MQPGYEDYYAMLEYGEGCCLNCPDSEEGCLCYNCKCKNCLWYSPLEEYNGEKGHCDKTDELKQRKQNKWIKKFSESMKEKKIFNPQITLNKFENEKNN